MALSGPYRQRVLTYGPDAARMLLRSFDDLAGLIDDLRIQTLDL